MKTAQFLAFGLSALILTTNLVAQGAPLPQRVLYIGDRSSAFEPLLKEYFASHQSVSRQKFKPLQAKDFDVVLLDWPQSGGRRGAWLDGAPLGKREEWNKPTVLLGSAGLNLAVAWKLKGGSGCTCLAPVACGLSNHVIFQSPIAINVKATANISTPQAFVRELKEPNLDVLPLVDHVRSFATVLKDYRAGWCSYYYEFADVPEVEFFCSGINQKTPRASALWRQGNLLHFGFEQSPAEMNETGRAMLVNAIAYISRFSEDRPIDITPSVFGPEKISLSRRRVKNYLPNPGYRVEWSTNDISAATLAAFDWRDRAAAATWLETNGIWLHPGQNNLLEIDAEAKSLGTPFDSPEFLPKSVAAMRDERTTRTAAIVLARYAPEGPGEDATVGAWEKWWRENSPYLFYSELGCYRWYIDPLAKKRGIRTQDLRGPARADSPH